MRKYVWQTWRMCNLRCVRSAYAETWLSRRELSWLLSWPPACPRPPRYQLSSLGPFANIYALHFVRHIVWIYLLALSLLRFCLLARWLLLPGVLLAVCLSCFWVLPLRPDVLIWTAAAAVALCEWALWLRPTICNSFTRWDEHPSPSSSDLFIYCFYQWRTFAE